MITQRSTHRTTGVAYLWLFTLGIFGAHHFYLGNASRGILYSFTGGLFLMGWVADMFTLSEQVRRANMEHWARESAMNTQIIATK